MSSFYENYELDMGDAVKLLYGDRIIADEEAVFAINEDNRKILVCKCMTNRLAKFVCKCLNDASIRDSANDKDSD
jgi:hypothetical protein